MADNTPQNGTATIATDEVTTLNGGAVSAVQVQRVKPVYGDDGIARDVSTAFPLPIIASGNRTSVILSASAVTSVTTEALFSLSQYRAGTVTSGTQYTVAAGKTLRVQAVQFGSRFITPSATATFASAKFNLRWLVSGTLSATTSPLVYSDTKMSASNTPTPNSDLAIPDGIDFPAGSVIGVSHVDSAATLALDVLIVGYEY